MRSHEVHYEDGEWRFQPSDDEMADYRIGLDELVEKRTRQGRCG
ncbi:hypothetical protein ACQP2F_19590 [Actinoplanes sp. CA-030573]